MTTMTRTLRYGKGYSGKMGNKCWAARVTGTDSTYGLSRDFIDPSKVEREHFNRPRTMIDFSYELEIDGLYELCEGGERWFVGVYVDKDTGEAKAMKLSDARVKAWVTALNEGKTDKDARIASEGVVSGEPS